MGLTSDETVILALYLEFYGKCYNPNENTVLESKTTPKRNIEMQCMHFLLQEANVTMLKCKPKYQFQWKDRALDCPQLDHDLDALDKKEKAIEIFYQMYLNNIKSKNLFHKNYYEQLKAVLSSFFLEDHEVLTITRLFYGLEDMIKVENGIEIITLIVYCNKYVCHGAPRSTEWIANFLEEQGYHIDPSLLKRICILLRVLGLLETEPKRKKDFDQIKKFIPADQK